MGGNKRVSKAASFGNGNKTAKKERAAANKIRHWHNKQNSKQFNQRQKNKTENTKYTMFTFWLTAKKQNSKDGKICGLKVKKNNSRSTGDKYFKMWGNR
jgi:hypothetical protein